MGLEVSTGGGIALLGEENARGLKISAEDGLSGICRPIKPRDCLRIANEEPADFGWEEGSNHRTVGVGGSANGAGLFKRGGSTFKGEGGTALSDDLCGLREDRFAKEAGVVLGRSHSVCFRSTIRGSGREAGGA